MSTVFSDDQSAQQQITNALETLVGEGKKFKDVEALAKGKLEADAFIQKLTDEQAHLRAELEKAMNLEQQLAALSRGEPGQNAGATHTAAASATAGTALGIKPEDVEALLETKLSEREAKAVQAKNLSQVDEYLIKQYGDVNKAKDAVKQIESTLGVNIRELAAVSPAAVIKLVGGQAGNGLPAEHGTVRVTTQTGEVRNKAWYDAKRKEMGNARFYADRRLQVQLHKDAQSLGDAFY